MRQYKQMSLCHFEQYQTYLDSVGRHFPCVAYLNMKICEFDPAIKIKNETEEKSAYHSQIPILKSQQWNQSPRLSVQIVC